MANNEEAPPTASSNKTIDDEIRRLQARIRQLEAEKETTIASTPPRAPQNFESSLKDDNDNNTTSLLIERYSRQLLCGAWDPAAQQRLAQSTVLVVGAGGIGSAVLPYLCGAGVGTLLIADHDTVDVSNLHRQVLHTTPTDSSNPVWKAISAQERLQQLNPTICIETIHEQPITQLNVQEYVSRSTCVVDASDNPATRYLLNDACRQWKKPLVSASAIQTTAQLTVYEPDQSSSCYRCLYPRAPATTTDSCSDVGVLGPVPGMIGTLQAMETLKVLTGYGTPLRDHILVYDAAACTFLRLRKPQNVPPCRVCRGDTASGEEDEAAMRGPSCSIGGAAATHEGNDSSSISVTDYKELHDEQRIPHLLVDVRVEAQYALCRLPGSISLPLEEWTSAPSCFSDSTLQYFCICRRGIASQEATRRLQELGVKNVVNIRGGLDAWRSQVDPQFPKY